MKTSIATPVPARNAVDQKAAILKLRMTSLTTPPRFIEKVLGSSNKNPTAAAFNVWHANSDIGIGSDNPWGSSGNPTGCSE